MVRIRCCLKTSEKNLKNRFRPTETSETCSLAENLIQTTFSLTISVISVSSSSSCDFKGAISLSVML